MLNADLQRTVYPSWGVWSAACYFPDSTATEWIHGEQYLDLPPRSTNGKTANSEIILSIRAGIKEHNALENRGCANNLDLPYANPQLRQSLQFHPTVYWSWSPRSSRRSLQIFYGVRAFSERLSTVIESSLRYNCRAWDDFFTTIEYCGWSRAVFTYLLQILLMHKSNAIL